MVISMKADFKLLKFPEKEIYYERLMSIINSINDPEHEYDCCYQVIMALVDFFNDIDHEYSAPIRIELLKVLFLIETMYEDF